LRRDASLLEKTKKSAASLRWDKVARKGLLAVAATIVLLLSYLPSAQGLDWEEIKESHFIIYHFKQDKEFAREVSRKAEEYYKSIPDRLGISRYSNSWSWDNRVKIYIYPDRVTFLEQTGTQGWSRAIANYITKEISFYKGCDDGTSFPDKTFPHEVAHLVFRDFAGEETKIPLWLDEGVAQLMEAGKAAKARPYLRKRLNTDNFITVDTLTRLDIRRVRDRTLVNIFYLEACSLVDFLIEKYGSRRFIDLCEEIRDGETFKEALAEAYPSDVDTVEELNESWIEYLKQLD